jgi:hypothetical protein
MVINDILGFSKIELGPLELDAHPVDLRDCVEGALDLIAPRAAEKNLDLSYRIDDGAPGALIGDVTRLRQVLVNRDGRPRGRPPDLRPLAAGAAAPDRHDGERDGGRP